MNEVTVPTDTICEAAGGVHITTVHRWAKWGLLPAPEKVFLGRRGTVARWPKIAVEQARWVLERLDSGMTKEEVRTALERGDFKPGAPTADPQTAGVSDGAELDLVRTTEVCRRGHHRRAPRTRARAA